VALAGVALGEPDAVAILGGMAPIGLLFAVARGALATVGGGRISGLRLE